MKMIHECNHMLYLWELIPLFFDELSGTLFTLESVTDENDFVDLNNQ